MEIYKSIIENSPNGYLYLKILFDENNIPFDYEFIELNKTFENLSGSLRSEVIGKRLSVILKSIKTNEFDWFKFYNEVIENDSKKEYELYSIPLKKWYKVLAYSIDKESIVTVFNDITDKYIQEIDFNKMSNVADDFLMLTKKEIDFQQILDNLIDITQARFGAFNLYDEDGESYTTLAIAGNRDFIIKAMNIIGIDLEKKKWSHDIDRAEKIKDRTITRFHSLHDLAGHVIPKPVSDILSMTFNLGELVLVKILRNSKMMGDFTLVMPKDVLFDKDSIVEMFSRQVGLMIERRRAEEKLKLSELRFRQLVLNLDAGVVIHANDGSIIESNQRASDLLGLSVDQLKGKESIDPDWVFVNEDGSHMVFSEYPINLVLKHKKAIKNKFMGVRHTIDRKIVWVMVNGVPILNENNEITEVVISFIDFTELKNTEVKKTESELQYRLLASQMQLGLAVHDVILDDKGNVVDYRFIDLNKAFEDLTQLKRELIIGKTVLEVLPETEYFWIEKYGRVAIAGEPIYFESYSKELDKYFQISAYSPKPKQFATIFSDITNLKKAEVKLNENMTDLLESQRIAHIGTWRLNLVTNQVIWTEELYKMYGFDPKLPPPPFTEHMKLFKAESWNRLSEALEHTRESGVPYELELETVNINGKNGWMWVRGEASRDSNGNITSLWGAAQDITEYKRIQNELLHLSYHDHLTGLFNRRYFEECLTNIDKSENLPLSVIMCDVNGLKIVNDSFGHDSGDLFLKKASEVISKVCRERDIVARIGGDEFAILLPNTSAEETVQIANQIKTLASKELVSNIELSISYGYETKNNHKQIINEIISSAENHMYRHKLSERSSIRSKTIDLIMNALFEKSKREAMHSYRVGEICQEIARQLNFNQDTINQMRIAGLIHDIGKIGIDEKILNKNAGLDVEEREEVQRHPEIGWRLLSSTNEFSNLSLFILNHHEKWDGRGYPNGLVGEQIPIESRIISIADAYDAMTSERSYRKPLSKDEAIKELISCSGTHFDPHIIDIFINKVLKNSNFDSVNKDTNRSIIR